MGRKSYRNDDYTIRRSNLFRALNLPDKIPVGQVGEWKDVRVVVGWYDEEYTQKLRAREDCPQHLRDYEPKTIVLPFVRLVAKGVANRVQVQCPMCRTWMRFCALQQHTGSKTCRETRRALALARFCEKEWTIRLPTDAYPTVGEAAGAAIDQAKEEWDRYVMPATWSALYMESESNDSELVFNVMVVWTKPVTAEEKTNGDGSSVEGR